MKKLTTVLLLALAVLLVTLFAACGSETPATTTPATTTNPTVTTPGNAETTPKVNETTPKAPVTTTKPTEGFVEADHVTKTETGVTVKSLDKSFVMNIVKNSAGNIVYTLTSGDEVIIGESDMGITIGDLAGFTGSTFEAVTAKELNVSYSHLGKFSTLTDNCVAATVTMKSGDYTYTIEIKLYNNSVAFRYNMPSIGKSRPVKAEATSFTVNNLQKVWFGQNSDCYESVITSSAYSSISTTNKLTGPLMIELANNGG
ncbi:MAG: glycoside hydrolase family 97 N-terminal domain-containing protein, partial [Clostridia bacterium]|nr:glycoside hydrolase family 97 N-terminal domain-containing protein [Clostridia bacterium]